MTATPAPEQQARAREIRQAIDALRGGAAPPARTPRDFTEEAARKARAAETRQRPRAPAKKAP